MTLLNAKNMLRISAVALLALALMPASASAYHVYSPNVTPGETAVSVWGEASGGEDSAGNKQPESKRMQVELRHTFYDRLDLGAGVVGETGASGNAGEDIGYSRLKARAVMQVTDKKTHVVDFGIYMDYQHMSSTMSSSTPHYFNLFLLFEKDFDTWHVNFNPGIRKNMSTIAGAQDNVAEYQAEYKYHFLSWFNPGIQAYGVNMGEWNALSNELQYAGPAFDGNLTEIGGFTLHYEGAVLMGLSTASKNMIINGVVELRF